MTPDANPEFEALLNYLKANRECDLTGYKRSTLMRRFQHRMVPYRRLLLSLSKGLVAGG